MASRSSNSAHRVTPLADGWEVAAVAPSAATDPVALGRLTPEWLAAQVPGTAASAWRAAGRWSFETPRDFDAEDWWFRCRFPAGPVAGGTRRVLTFAGLATLADVWLNGTHLFQSENMFLAHEADVTSALRADNELLIRFRALQADLSRKRPRPRWRTRLVSHQQLRWIRTTLLGRMPGWSPPVAAVGPWRAVALEERRILTMRNWALATRIERDDGVVRAELVLEPAAGVALEGAELHVGESRVALSLSRNDSGTVTVSGELRVPGAQRWWPHTHGAQPLYPARVTVRAGGESIALDCGRVGFRDLELHRGDGDGFEVRVNGVPVFCRGACWTSADIVTLDGTPDVHRRFLTLARDGGTNMVRVGGTMVYESEAFFDCCDELGILVWHDFMFANMDYPATDQGWMAGVRDEVSHFLAGLQGRPSIAVLCGGSEVEQQASMLGLPSTMWSNGLFRDALPAWCDRGLPGVPYWPASPGGGTLPFHPDTGVAHYYGVGAYLRPLEDARRSGVRFTSECLAFANVPHDETVSLAVGGAQPAVHHPRWKERVPRDSGAGWDFEDVRDHYLATLFGVDPMRLRYADTPRYLEMSRVVTGEIMEATFAEWRRAGSSCRGGLVWFYQDLWPGAGWGVVDSTGRPKAAYYYLQRAWQPLALLAIDEGLNGLRLHAVNDTAAEIRGTVRLTLYRHGETPVATGFTPIVVPPRGVTAVSADALLEGFRDVTYAYRFGPPGHDVAIAVLTRDGSDEVLAEACHLPAGVPQPESVDLGLEAVAVRRADGAWEVTVRTRRFARAVVVDADAWRPNVNYFHLSPGAERTVVLQPAAKGAATDAVTGVVSALNGRAPVKITTRE